MNEIRALLLKHESQIHQVEQVGQLVEKLNAKREMSSIGSQTDMTGETLDNILDLGVHVKIFSLANSKF